MLLVLYFSLLIQTKVKELTCFSLFFSSHRVALPWFQLASSSYLLSVHCRRVPQIGVGLAFESLDPLPSILLDQDHIDLQPFVLNEVYLSLLSNVLQDLQSLPQFLVSSFTLDLGRNESSNWC